MYDFLCPPLHFCGRTGIGGVWRIVETVVGEVDIGVVVPCVGVGMGNMVHLWGGIRRREGNRGGLVVVAMVDVMRW